jgi:hypothetical protein
MASTLYRDSTMFIIAGMNEPTPFKATVKTDMFYRSHIPIWVCFEKTKYVLTQEKANQIVEVNFKKWVHQRYIFLYRQFKSRFEHLGDIQLLEYTRRRYPIIKDTSSDSIVYYNTRNKTFVNSDKEVSQSIKDALDKSRHLVDEFVWTERLCIRYGYKLLR